jgi:hypothetical protein
MRRVSTLLELEEATSQALHRKTDTASSSDTNFEIAPNESVMLVIEANHSAIHAEMEKLALSSPPTIEEHITIYNRRKYSEKYEVILYMPGVYCGERVARQNTVYRHLHQFLSLEGMIVDFMQLFSQIWDRIGSACSNQELDKFEALSSSYGGGSGGLSQGGAKDSDIEMLRRLILPTMGSGSHNGGSEAEGIESEKSSANTLPQLYSRLFFEFYYITDELAFFANRYSFKADSNGQRSTFKLATLFYTFVLKHRIIQRFLESDLIHMALTSNDNTPYVASSNISASSSSSSLLPPAATSSLLGSWVKQLSFFLSIIPMKTPETEVLFDMHRSLTESSKPSL